MLSSGWFHFFIQISISSNFWARHFGIVSRSPVIMDTIIIFTFHNFFTYLARFRFFSHLFIFSTCLSSARMTVSTMKFFSLCFPWLYKVFWPWLNNRFDLLSFIEFCRQTSCDCMFIPTVVITGDWVITSLLKSLKFFSVSSDTMIWAFLVFARICSSSNLDSSGLGTLMDMTEIIVL